MGDQKSTTTTSGLNNDALNSAVTTIGGQLNKQLGIGSKVYNQPLYPGVSSTTQGGVSALANNPNNQNYSAGISDTLAQQANIASGNVVNDPVRKQALDDALKASNATFTASGRFGSGSHDKNMAAGAVTALAGLDYGRQQQAIQNLPALYGASQLPAQSMLAAGQITDADMLAQRQAAADLFDRQNNAGWNTLQRGASILSGTAPSAGTTTTQTTSVPWWQTAGGIGAGLLSFWPNG